MGKRERSIERPERPVVGILNLNQSGAILSLGKARNQKMQSADGWLTVSYTTEYREEQEITTFLARNTPWCEARLDLNFWSLEECQNQPGRIPSKFREKQYCSCSAGWDCGIPQRETKGNRGECKLQEGKDKKKRQTGFVRLWLEDIRGLTIANSPLSA